MRLRHSVWAIGRFKLTRSNDTIALVKSHSTACTSHSQCPHLTNGILKITEQRLPSLPLPVRESLSLTNPR
jgi:hypothetical protein